MPSVFISHSSLDRDSVEQSIIMPLREHGIAVWYSKDSIETADEWEKKIKDGLKNCEWFLVVMTPRSVASRWVQREVFWAVDRREGRIIPVMLETCEPEDLNLALFPMQYIDFRQSMDLARHQLLSKLTQETGTQIDNLYDAAKKAIAGQEWTAAIKQLEELLRLAPGHAAAQDQISYARQQEKLAGLYYEGVNHFNAGRLKEALGSFDRVQAIERGYRNVPALIAGAAAELNKLEEGQHAIKMREATARTPRRKEKREAPPPHRRKTYPVGSMLNVEGDDQQTLPSYPVPKPKRRWLRRLVFTVLALLFVGGVTGVIAAYLAYIENQRARARNSQPIPVTSSDLNNANNAGSLAPAPVADGSDETNSEESASPTVTAESPYSAPTMPPATADPARINHPGVISLEPGTGFIFLSQQTTSGEGAYRDIWWNGLGLVPYSRMYSVGQIDDLGAITYVAAKAVEPGEFKVTPGEGFVIEINPEGGLSYAVIRVVSIESRSITFEWLYPFRGPLNTEEPP